LLTLLKVDVTVDIKKIGYFYYIEKHKPKLKNLENISLEGTGYGAKEVSAKLLLIETLNPLVFQDSSG